MRACGKVWQLRPRAAARGTAEHSLVMPRDTQMRLLERFVAVFEEALMTGSSNGCRKGALAVAVLASAVSLAYARPDARTMTCSQLQALLAQEGAAAITTGQNTYDRYVSSGTSCIGTEVARAAYVATSDTSQCQVYQCGRRIRNPRF
jgi:hypothetical protein